MKTRAIIEHYAKNDTFCYCLIKAINMKLIDVRQAWNLLLDHMGKNDK